MTTKKFISNTAPSVTSNGVRSLFLSSLLLSAFCFLLISSCDECADCGQNAGFEVSPAILIFNNYESDGQVRTFNVTSTMPWKLIATPDGFTYSVTQGEAGLTVVTVTLTDFDEDGFVTVWAEAENGTKKAVKLTVVKKGVVPVPEPPIEAPLSYVGAFWRANQTGERIIRLKDMNDQEGNRGAWSASVYWLDDRWEKEGVQVVLSNIKLTDLETRGIYGATPGDAEAYQVSGSAITVNGVVNAANPDILFRIGLKRKFSDSPAYEPNDPNYNTTWPARYGLVLISYNDHKKGYKLYLRQGEGADYVMRPEDFGVNGESWGSPNPRPKAARFSPYNLTAATLNAQVGINGAGSNPGIFTEYPTQAGAYFNWAFRIDPRYAWDPYTVGAIPGWKPFSYVDNENWDYFGTGATHETCPAGYHRPSGGALSEITQSLYAGNYNPLDCRVWGYYADGFFDRFAKGDVSSVCTTSAGVAYFGSLFFNPITNANLFFPAAGTRRSTGLSEAGTLCLYYSATQANVHAEYTIFAHTLFLSTISYNPPEHRDYPIYGGDPHSTALIAASIRCVRNASVL